MGRYQELKALKDKYAKEILAIEGVHAVGIRVLENKIVVYCDDIEPLTLLSIPTELETVIVDVMGSAGNPTLAIWNEETPIPMQNNEGGLRKYRPFPAGVSIGHYAITAGTVGIPLWSRKLNKPVMVSNNHVLADSTSNEEFGMIRSRCRQFTNPKQITISSGGTPYTESGLIETVTIETKFTWDFNKPVITDITPSNVQAGDIITITGKSLGFRMGYSKVWVNDVQAKVKSWTSTSNNMIHNYMTFNDDRSYDTDSTVEVYVPDGIIGQVEVKIEVEGDPIVQPGRKDGGTLLDQVGQLEDYEPLVPAMAGLTAKDYTRGDVAIFSFIDENIFANKVITHGGRYKGAAPGFGDGVNDPPFVGSFYFDSGREYFANGVQEEFCEKLPVMKVGRTTGTTMSVIFDPSYSVSFAYPGYFGSEVIDDCVLMYGNYCLQLWDEEYGIPYMADPVWNGDSGSSCFIASRADYFAYMNYYNLVHINELGQTSTMTNADFDLVEQIVPIEPMNFVGNIFAHMGVIDITKYTYGVTDKAINWIGTLDVYPLGLENPYMQLPMTTSTNATTVFIDNAIYLDLQVNATAEINGSAECYKEINISNINLTPALIQPSNNITINLEFLGDAYNIVGNSETVSELKASLNLVYIYDLLSQNNSYTIIQDLQSYTTDILSIENTTSQFIDSKHVFESLLSIESSSTLLTDFQQFKESLLSSDITFTDLSHGYVEFIENLLSVSLSDTQVKDLQQYIDKILSTQFSETTLTELQEFLGRLEDLLDSIYTETKINDYQVYNETILSIDILAKKIDDLQSYIDKILSIDINDTLIDDIQSFKTNLEEILMVCFTETQITEAQSYVATIISNNITQTKILENYKTLVQQLYVSLAYISTFLKLRYNGEFKPTRYDWMVVGMGEFKNGMFNFTLGESQEIPVQITSGDGTQFVLSGAYEYRDENGIVIDSGDSNVNGNILFTLLNFDTLGIDQKLIYKWICTPIDDNGNPDNSRNVETGISIVTINVLPPQ